MKSIFPLEAGIIGQHMLPYILSKIGRQIPTFDNVFGLTGMAMATRSKATTQELQAMPCQV